MNAIQVYQARKVGKAEKLFRSQKPEVAENDYLLINERGGGQCDKIGRFLKILGGKFSFKSSPNVWWHLGHFENINFEVKMAVVTFLGTFIKNGLLF